MLNKVGCLLFFFSIISFSQDINTTAYVLDFQTETAIADVNVLVLDQNQDTLFVTTTNYKGVFIIPYKKEKFITKFQLSHISYGKQYVNYSLENIYFFKRENINLQEINLEVKSKAKQNLLESVLPFTTNLSFNEKVATFIEYDPDKGKKIKSLKFHVVDVFGVKNIKYLPFKASLYTVDSISGLPKNSIMDSVPIIKKNNKKWVEVDVSKKNINIPEEGIFIVFEVLSYDMYPQKYIRSKEGLIHCAPAVKTKRSKHKSSLRLKEDLSLKNNNTKKHDNWIKTKGYYFNMELETINSNF